MKQGNAKFRYDTQWIQKYSTQMGYNIYKGILESNREITYQEIANQLLTFYSNTPTKFYNLNQPLIDSRGRVIYQCTKKLFNPISHKDARACVITKSRPLTDDGLVAVQLFVAELLGLKATTLEEKIELGKEAIRNCTLPSEDNLHEYIWLSRIYENLTDPEHWNVPIEVDATASILQMIGTLTNNHMYLYGTNLAENNNKLEDIWNLPNVSSRTLTKRALTRILYGSSQTASEIWDVLHLDYTIDDVFNVNTELLEGKFKEARDFSKFIIENNKPTTTMDVEIFRDKFTIYCNKFDWEKTETVTYFVWSGTKLRKITRNVQRVPDFNRFKLYFVTLLCHNLDSQVADTIANTLDWVLPNHDSFTLHPNDASRCRELYAKLMHEIYLARHDILDRFFRSIGIVKKYRDVDKDNLNFSPNALK